MQELFAPFVRIAILFLMSLVLCIQEADVLF